VTLEHAALPASPLPRPPRRTEWLRRRLLTGFFISVPLIISVAAMVWIFGIIDSLTAPLATRLLGPEPDAFERLLVASVGILATLLVVLVVGIVATNVIGRRAFNRAESWLMMIPVFRTIYAPVKQLVVAFSPDNEYGFKRVVMVEDPHRGWIMGFLTKEFTVDRGSGPEALMAVYVPTNHLYLGDVVLYPRERAFFPDLTVEEGIRIFLTGGMSLPGRIVSRH
jgi:uncharacterized membrane protein